MGIVKETKKVLGYSEDGEITCMRGRFSIEEENSPLDRDRAWYCTYSNICRFKVSPKAGTCDMLERVY